MLTLGTAGYWKAINRFQVDQLVASSALSAQSLRLNPVNEITDLVASLYIYVYLKTSYNIDPPRIRTF